MEDPDLLGCTLCSKQGRRAAMRYVVDFLRDTLRTQSLVEVAPTICLNRNMVERIVRILDSCMKDSNETSP